MNLSDLKASAGLDSWHFQLDNPTILGWSVVAFYGIAAACCAVAAVLSGAPADSGAPGRRNPKSSGIWGLLALALAFLGVNKQLNLQTMFIVMVRHFSSVGGLWYERRRLQLIFSVVFGLAVGFALVWLASRYRDFFNQNRQVFWGVIVLGLFIALRTATINHADSYLRIDLRDEHWAWVMEILGSVLIGLGAVQQTSRKAPK